MKTLIFQRPRIVKAILTLSILISLTFLVFAFIQKAEADKQKNLAEQCLHIAESQRLMAEQSRREAELARQKVATCAGR